MNLHFSRLALLALLGATLLAIGLTGPAPVLADRPTKEFLPAADTTLTDVCTFPVFVHFAANKEYLKTYRDKEDNVAMYIVTGEMKVELTNLLTNKKVAVNISGSFKDKYYPDGSEQFDLTGPSLFWYFGDPLLPAMFTNSGLTRFRWDAQGNFTYSFTGHMTDMCSALGN